jgi:hypothetical protein
LNLDNFLPFVRTESKIGHFVILYFEKSIKKQKLVSIKNLV